MSQRDTMSDLERAVYDLAAADKLTAAHSRLYSRPIGKLARAGLLRRRPDGGYEAVKGGALQPEAAPAPVMVAIWSRVPEEWLPAIDAVGPDRSTAIRALLGKALAAGSGLRKAVGFFLIDGARRESVGA